MSVTDNNTQAPHLKTTGVHWLLLAAVTAVVIVLDQASKAYVVAHLDRYESWMPVAAIKPVFRFTHVHNTGAAFGMLPQGGTVFLIISLVVSAIIVYYYRRLTFGGWVVRLALGLQLGGALGNAIDRVRLGYVVDFLKVAYWPVFNIADSCIVIGVALLAFAMLREEWRLAQQEKESEAEDSTSDHAAIQPEEQAYG